MAEFRPVEGHPKYLVSDQGEIVSLKGKNPRIRSQAKDKGGYHRITMDKKTLLVHRVVAKAFEKWYWAEIRDLSYSQARQGWEACWNTRVFDGEAVTLKAMALRTGMQGRDIQRRYSAIHRKRAATWEDFTQ